MTPRENLLSLWRRTGYETAPVQFGMCPFLEETYRRETGSKQSYAEVFEFPWRDMPWPRQVPQGEVDWHRYYEEQGEPLDDDAQINPWGAAMEKGSAAAMHMRKKRHPMLHFDSLEQFEAYPYPQWDEDEIAHIEQEVNATHACRLAATGNMACTIWETAWAMRGMESLMMDMLEDEPWAAYLLDRVTDTAVSRARAFCRAGVDHLHVGDDVGMQSRLMMSIEMWRDWLKPRLARVIATAKAARPEVIVSYHSCGYVTPLIDDLIEIGVDVLNPVQSECMDFAEIHAAYGDRLSFWGTLGTQTTMPFGTPDDVRRVVRTNLEIAGDKGGLLCTPTHMLEPEVPWENILAYVDACREFVSAGV